MIQGRGRLAFLPLKYAASLPSGQTVPPLLCAARDGCGHRYTTAVVPAELQVKFLQGRDKQVRRPGTGRASQEWQSKEQKEMSTCWFRLAYVSFHRQMEQFPPIAGIHPLPYGLWLGRAGVSGNRSARTSDPAQSGAGTANLTSVEAASRSAWETWNRRQRSRQGRHQKMFAITASGRLSNPVLDL